MTRHLTIDGCDTNKVVQQIAVDVRIEIGVNYSAQFVERVETDLKESIDAILQKYFDSTNYCSYSDEEWKELTENYNSK